MEWFQPLLFEFLCRLSSNQFLLIYTKNRLFLFIRHKKSNLHILKVIECLGYECINRMHSNKFSKTVGSSHYITHYRFDERKKIDDV
jgi:hypothetical protein